MQMSRLLIGLLRQLAKSSDLLTATGKEEVQGVINEIERNLGPGEHVRELSYSEAMKYFKTHAPKHQKATQGIIMRERMHSGGIHIIQVFLDAKDEIIPQSGNEKLPYGRQIFADRLDQELEEAFNSANMILVK